jgi:broad specificity phosphatase PhoE
LVEPPAELAVTTFGAGKAGGEAARRFYMHLGFAPAETAPPGPEGGPRQVFRRVFADGPRLILVRHSLPELDLGVPANEWHLSAEGRRRCLALAERLAAYAYAPDVVLSSVEPKAIETAELVVRHLGLPSETVVGLQEHERSEVGRLDRDQFHDAVARLFARPADLTFGSETAHEARLRFAAAVDGVLRRYPDANVALVTHGTVLSLFVAHVAGVDGYRLWRQLGLPCFVVLSRPDLWLVEVVDDVTGAGT